MAMGDMFKEQIVKRQATSTDVIKRIGIILATIIVAFVALSLPIQMIGPFIAAGAVFGAWYIMSFFKVEYEYSFTAGELDIDAIYNRSRRKRVFSARVNDFEIMAHVEDNMHTGALSNAQVQKDYSSGVVGKDTYAFIINYENKRTKIIIEPNEVMLKALASVLTRRRLHVKL